MEDLKVEITDLETLVRCFLWCSFVPETGQKFQYEISRRKNELDGLVKHVKDNLNGYIVTCNGLNFDNQVIQFIIDNYENWADKTIEEIAELISNFGAECIDKQKYELRQVYNCKYMDFDNIDLMEIHHFSNKARRCSLKWLEFSMDFPDIEEMPIDFRKDYLTNEEIEETIKYCWNDVMATYEFYKITRGDTGLELYRGKDKIQERLDVMEEFGFGKECLSWSDVKIGDEINKKGYMQETGCTMNDIYKKKKSRKPTPHFTFGDCIPSYVKFKTKEFNDFYNSVKGRQVNLNKTKQTFPFRYGNTNYTIAQGGIHSEDKPRVLTSDDTYIKKDADVGSQYPNAINKRGLFPSHLGKGWNARYGKSIHTRIDYKSRGKSNRKFKSLAEMYKLVLNGGGFGMTSQKDNWQYDPFVTFACTIGNQFEILMLIEAMELEGISVVSANTDGIVCDIPRELEDRYYEICHEWERGVGNDKIGQLEYADYKKLVQTSVNDYLAIGADNKTKMKGDFVTTEIELHKNKSNRISPIAVYEYFVNGTPVEETIRNSRNIYHFCIGKKASNDYFYRQVDRKSGIVKDLNKLVRYYCVKPPDTKKDSEIKIPALGEMDMRKYLESQNWQRVEITPGQEDWLSPEKEIAYENALKSGKIGSLGGIWDYTTNGLENAYKKAYLETVTPVNAEINLSETDEVKNVVPGKLYKIKKEGSEKTGPKVSQCESGSSHQQVFNRYFTVDKWEDYQIDYSYYIEKTNALIDKVDPYYKRDRKLKASGQLSMF